jgi:hypothetical protein
MICPHCGIAFHVHWETTSIRASTAADKTKWLALVTRCPTCAGETIVLRHMLPVKSTQTVLCEILAYPKPTKRKPTPKEVPNDIREDYEEACRVLVDSNKASAALSRRCLQAILRGQGYAQRDLAQQIDALLGERDPAKTIPSALRDTVDAIRNFGNFSAHPVTDQTTLQVIDVEPGEAEWCLEILEDMFDHYYVTPAVAAARKAELNKKLFAAGKPLAK